MTRFAKYLIVVSLEYATLYGWFGLHSEGCENLMRFYVALCFIVADIACSVIGPGDVKAPRAPALQRKLSVVTDIALAACFVWFGHAWLACFWLASLVFLWSADTNGRKPEGQKKGGQTQTVGAGSVGIQAGGDVYARHEA